VEELLLEKGFNNVAFDGPELESFADVFFGGGVNVRSRSIGILCDFCSDFNFFRGGSGVSVSSSVFSPPCFSVSILSDSLFFFFNPSTHENSRADLR